MQFPNFVVCGECGTAQPSAIQVHRRYSRATFSNNFQSCVRCKKMVRLPEGVFSSVTDSLDVLAAVDNPIERLDGLREALTLIQSRPDTADPQHLLNAAGIAQANQLAKTVPSQPQDRRIWAATLLAAIAYAWEKLPQGALSWIELFGKIRGHIG